MADDTNPPVGATVVDSDGLEYECVRHIEKWAKWRTTANLIEADVGTDDALTALWRMQQERDQLQQRAEQAEARLQELREALAIHRAEMEDLQFELRAQLAAARADTERLLQQRMTELERMAWVVDNGAEVGPRSQPVGDGLDWYCSHRYTKRHYYGETPTLAIDNARAALAAIDATKGGDHA